MRLALRVLVPAVLLGILAAQAATHNGEAPPPPLRAGRPPDTVGPGAITPDPRRTARGAADGLGWTVWWSRNGERLLDLLSRRDASRRKALTSSSAQFFGSGSAGNRRLLGERPPEHDIVTALLKASRDPDEDVATSAIIALGKSRSLRAIPALLRLLRPDATGRLTVQVSAVLALGLAGGDDPEACRFLLDCVGDGRRALRERAYAAVALGHLRAVGAIPILAARARDEEEHIEARAACVLGLGLIGDEIVLPDLAAFLTDPRWVRTRHAPVRACAAAAIEKLGSRAGIRALVVALEDDHRDVQRQAVISLGSVAVARDERVVKALLGMLAKERDRSLMAFAATALGEIGHPETAPVLFALCRDGDSTVGPYGALGLGLLLRDARDPALRATYVPRLRSALATESRAEIWGALAVALGIARDRSSVPALARLLRSRESPWLRGNAALALGYLGAREIAPDLRKALEPRGDTRFQREVALALGLLGDREGTEILVHRLEKGTTEHARAGAALALGHLLAPHEAGPSSGSSATVGERTPYGIWRPSPWGSSSSAGPRSPGSGTT